jgi:hypothetical protein
VLGIASGYKAKASASQLGLPLNANLVKARSVTAERAAAKLASEGKWVRIDALLYKDEERHRQEQLHEVSLTVFI